MTGQNRTRDLPYQRHSGIFGVNTRLQGIFLELSDAFLFQSPSFGKGRSNVEACKLATARARQSTPSIRFDGQCGTRNLGAENVGRPPVNLFRRWV